MTIEKTSHCKVNLLLNVLGRRADGFAPSAQAFADLLAGYVERHPYQFFNFFDLWALAAPEPPGTAGKE